MTGNTPLGQQAAMPYVPARQHVVPPGTSTFGMILFLSALGMLFASSILGYLIIRFGGNSPAFGSIHMPMALWLSTALLLASSYAIHRALQNVRRERQSQFRKALTATFLLAIAFLLVQIPGLTALLGSHSQQLSTEEGRYYLYGLIFFLILIHALHVLGGIIPLGVITYKAHAGRYDHEHYIPVKMMAMYWHFLDGVWVVMFAVFLLAA